MRLVELAPSTIYTMTLPLPSLSLSPIRHQHCCLSLSSTLLNTVHRHITDITGQQSPPSTSLSIGSGTGLFEALLLRHLQTDLSPDITIEGVEVEQSSHGLLNRYLPEQYHGAVRSTRDLTPRVDDDDVRGLIFVYPRQPDLVSRYIQRLRSQRRNVDAVVIWLGPQADWTEFGPALQGGATVQTLQGEMAGLVEGEMMAVALLPSATKR